MTSNQLAFAAILAGASGTTPATPPLPLQGDLPSLDGASEWLNSPALTPAGLRGKVVLVQFWTYTCINWLRTLPYVRAWAEKYKEQGLVVIGVSTPEFEFEHSVENVRRSVKDMGMIYPIAIDNDYAIWRAFDNNYWPALYFVDAKGHISDIEAARDELVRRGIEVSDVFHYAGWNRVDPDARLSGPAPDRRSYASFVSFSDPDGNGWLLQEITTRLPGRIDASETAWSSASDLASALRRAEAAHGQHEKRTGQRDADWPTWYAAYMVAEQAGTELPT